MITNTKLHDISYLTNQSSNSDNSRYQSDRYIRDDKLTTTDVLLGLTTETKLNPLYMETKNPANIAMTDYSTHLVTKDQEGRLDKIAYIYYGDPKLWWLIAYANDIIDPRVVITNTYLKIPPVTDLYKEGSPMNG